MSHIKSVDCVVIPLAAAGPESSSFPVRMKVMNAVAFILVSTETSYYYHFNLN